MTAPSNPPAPLMPAAKAHLAATISESPETVVPIGLLLSRRARAHAVGHIGHFAAATIQEHNRPSVCWGFGADVAALANLLFVVPEWELINIRPGITTALAQMLYTRTGRPLLPSDELCFALTHPVRLRTDPLVRPLTGADLPLLAAAPPHLRGPDPALLLRERMAAGVVLNDQLVALAQAYAVSERYADIIAYTLPMWRARGWATVAIALVAATLQERGRVPVLRAGLDNEAARRIAARLRFREVGRRTHLRPA